MELLHGPSRQRRLNREGLQMILWFERATVRRAQSEFRDAPLQIPAQFAGCGENRIG